MSLNYLRNENNFSESIIIFLNRGYFLSKCFTKKEKNILKNRIESQKGFYIVKYSLRNIFIKSNDFGIFYLFISHMSKLDRI